jgi:putative membrane protein
MNAAQSFLADTWMHGGWGWGWMSLMMVVMLLFWGGLIFGIVWLVRNTVDRRPEPRNESPIDVLDRRFAEGAIFIDDYHARRQVLLNGTPGSNAASNEDGPVAAPPGAEGRRR